VYIDPADTRSPAGSDAIASWWVIEEAAGDDVQRALDDFVPRWLSDTWGFAAVHYFP